MKQKSKKKKGKSKMIGFVLFFYLFFGGTIFCQKFIYFYFYFLFWILSTFSRDNQNKDKKKEASILFLKNLPMTMNNYEKNKIKLSS